MNKLSLFLYLADLLSNLQGLAVFGLIVCIGVLGLGYNKDCYNKYGAQEYPFFALTLGYHKKYVALVIFLSIFIAVIPSTRTMYLISASESAEVVVNSPEAKDAFALLKEALTRTLDDKTSK